jgi:putative ABC transport system permease protein
MWHNTFLTVYRNFLRKKWYHFFQVLSLTIGLEATGFTVLYLEHEWTYDAWHPNADQKFRISYENKSGWFASLAKPYSDEVVSGNFAGVESVVRVRRWTSKYLYVKDKKFYEQKILFTDPCSKFLTFFDFPLVEGDIAMALSNSNSALISATLASKYFGDQPALGETIKLDTMHLTVTGVFADIPSNSHLEFDLLLTNAAAMEKASGYFTYVELNPLTDKAQFVNKLSGVPVEEGSFYKAKSITLLNLPEIHFNPQFTYELKPPGNRSYLWVLGSIGVIILLVAGTNFTNLSIALFAYRSKEIAVRKSVGASVQTLAKHFMFEAIFFVLISTAFSVGLIYLLSASFNDLMQIRLASPLSSSAFLFSMIALASSISILVALYPTIILPRIKVIDLFKRTGITNQHGLKLRWGLIAIQFTILFFVCISLWIINEQLEFIQNKDLGFRKDGIIKIKRAWNIDSTKYVALKSRLLQHNSIVSVSNGYLPGDEDYGFPFRGENGEIPEEGMLVQGTDFDYLRTLGITALDGLILNSDQSLWPGKVCVVNETLARKLNYDNPIGKKLILRPGQANERQFLIQGLVKDYNYNSLHTQIPPIMLNLSAAVKYVNENIFIRANTNNLQTTLRFISQTVNEIAPDVPLVIGFLDEDLEKEYLQETRLRVAAKTLVIISIVLCITGLIATCSYMIEFRMKEIAIRKVFGAMQWNIMALFSKVFVQVSVLGFVVGSIFAYAATSAWIQDFAYRITIGFTPFASAFVAILTSTILVVCLQSAKAVRLNPTKVLKDE